MSNETIIRITARCLSGEWNVHNGPDDGMRLTMTGAQPYPGPQRVNYTLAEWEREVNACAGYVRNTEHLPRRATYRAFVQFLQDEHADQQAQLQRRIDRYAERGDTIGVEICQSYLADFVPPLGACYWNDGWQCTSHTEMMEAD